MLKCYICKDLNFDSFEDLKNHLIEHKFKHGCEICNKIIISPNSLRLHIRKHEKVICKVCCKEYEPINEEAHNQSHEFLYSLDQLKGIVDIINQIQGNQVNSLVEKPAKIEKYFGDQAICPVRNCNILFESPNLLIDHFRNHLTNHSCTFCGVIFSDDEALEKHSFENVCRFYSCPTCNKQFSFELFIDHVVGGCVPRPKNINKIHSTNSKFINRLVYAPNDEYKYVFRCYICEMVFNTLPWLEEHLMVHGKRLLLCNKCLCVFDDDYQFINHPVMYCNYAEILELPKKLRLTLRVEVDTYLQSTNPELTLNSVDNTKDGVSKIHLLENPKVYMIESNNITFPCNICKLKFAEICFLQQHYRVHGKELIACPECLYIFETKLKFKNHYCHVSPYDLKRENQLRGQLKKYINDQFRNYNHSDVKLRHKRRCPKGKKRPYVHYIFKDSFYNGIHQRMTSIKQELRNIKFRTTLKEEIKSDTSSSIQSLPLNENDDFDLNNKFRNTIKEEITSECQPNTSSLVQTLPQNENDDNKFRTTIKEEIKSDTSSSIQSLPQNQNDDYDLNKILPRILERRKKCLLKKYEPEEEENNDVEYIDAYIEDLEKLNYDDLKEPPPKKMRIESDLDSYADSDSDSDSVDFLDKFEQFIKVSSQEEIGDESGVSSNKKLKMDLD